MFTILGSSASEPSLSLCLSVFCQLSLSLLSLFSIPPAPPPPLSLSLMWCCGSWLHSIQCKFTLIPYAVILVDKLQWSESCFGFLLLVCTILFSSHFALVSLTKGTLSLA